MYYRVSKVRVFWQLRVVYVPLSQLNLVSTTALQPLEMRCCRW